MASRRQRAHFEPPIELRFVDLFMIIITALILICILFGIMGTGSKNNERILGLRIATEAVPAAIVGSPYDLTMAAEGGSPPYVWERDGGWLPDGLQLTGNGKVVGVPLAGGQGKVGIRLKDRSGRSVSAQFNMTVRASSSEPTQRKIFVYGQAVSVPKGKVGTAYSAALKAEGALGVVTWELSGGQMPKGLSLLKSGELVGRPTEAGQKTFDVLAQDGTGLTTKSSVTVQVAEADPNLWIRIIDVGKLVLLLVGLVATAIIIYFFLVGIPPSPETDGTEGFLSKVFGRKG